MIGALNRAVEVYYDRGLKELARRLVRQIPYQISERMFGSLAYFKVRHAWNTARYETVDNPHQLVYVDPNDIRYFSARGEEKDKNIAHHRWQDIGKVIGGDWDRQSQNEEYAIKNSHLFSSIEAHFHRGVPWKETKYVKQSLSSLKDGDTSTWRAVVQSEADLWERCEQLDNLYSRIEEDGYKSKRQVFKSKSNDPMGYYPHTFKYTLDEVMVDCGRNGTLLLVDGKHRLFIAKILGVEEIPVLEVCRHQEGMADSAN